MTERSQLRLWHLIVVLLGLNDQPVSAHARDDAAEKESNTPVFIEDARKYVIESVNERAMLTLNETSLLNWTNPTRQPERGAIDIWMFDPRPLAIMSLFT